MSGLFEEADFKNRIAMVKETVSKLETAQNVKARAWWRDKVYAELESLIFIHEDLVKQK